MPKISVIIPVHNSSKYLKECLDSVVKQTYSDIEVICVNDGSCDNSGTILKDYAQKDPRIKVKTTECHGVGNARNVGIDMAQGDYLFFVDSDDVVHHQALSHLMDIEDKTNADIVCGKYKKSKSPTKKDEKKLFGQFSLEENPIMCFGQRPPKTPITVWNKLIKKEILGGETRTKIRFLPKVFYEDTAFTLEMFSQANSCALTPDATYIYRTGNGSIMRSKNTEQKVRDFAIVLKELNLFFKNRPEHHQVIFLNYLNFTLLPFLKYAFHLSPHLAQYMDDHLNPTIKELQKKYHSNKIHRPFLYGLCAFAKMYESHFKKSLEKLNVRPRFSFRRKKNPSLIKKTNHSLYIF